MLVSLRPTTEGPGGGVSSTEAELKSLMLSGLDGDGRAHAALLKQLAGYLRGYFARRLGPGAAEVEDLVQETLLAIHLKRETYDPSQLFTPWAYAIARYKLLDHFRRTGRRKAVPLEETADLFADENPEEGAVRRDVYRLISRLPPREQALMAAVKIEGLSMEEAAARHSMSVSAVKVAIHRSMKRLKQSIADEN
jgi:RNA polymerase sigma-70 factor (ECF subfamily)